MTPSSPPSPWSRHVPLLAGLLAVVSVVLSTGSVGVLTGSELFGAGTADTWGHAWGYGWAADSLAQLQFPFFDAPVDHPGNQRWWIIDLPIALGLVPLTWLAGAGYTYNIAMLLHVGLGGGATAALLRARGVGEALSVAVGVLVVHAPFVNGVFISGVPEALGLLVAPLLVLWVDRGLQTGRWRPLLGAALVSVVLVLDGVYGAIAGAWAAAVATSAAVLGAQQRWKVAARAGLVAGPAMLAMVGLRTALRVSEHPALYDAKTRTVLMGDAWILQPLGGADLSAWMLPIWTLPEMIPRTAHRHIVYVGAILPILMVWSAWRNGASRRPIAVAVVGGLLALGPALFFFGEAYTSAILPGTLLWVVGATNLYRLAGLVPVFGLVGVALALSAQNRPRLAWGALAAVALEWAVGSPVSWKLPTVPDPAGAVEAWLADQAQPGAVLDLPFDREGSRSRGAYPQRTFYLSTVHGRRVASGLYKPATMETRHPALGAFHRNVRLAWQHKLVPLGEDDSGKDIRLPPPPREHLADDLSRMLLRERFAFVTLDLELVVENQREGARQWASQWLGPPAVESADGLRMGWALPDIDLPELQPDDVRGTSPASGERR